jgi:hypothetical protein
MITYTDMFTLATRNFDMAVFMKPSSAMRDEGKEKDYTFLSIDRSEYQSIFDYLSSKEIKIKNPQTAYGASKGGVLDALGDLDDEDDENEDDDGSFRSFMLH